MGLKPKKLSESRFLKVKTAIRRILRNLEKKQKRMSSIALKRFLAFPLKKTAIRSALRNLEIQQKHKNFVDVDDVDVRGGGSVSMCHDTQTPCHYYQKLSASVWGQSQYHYIGGFSQCGGSDIADIAPPTLWLELQPQTTP